MQRLFVIFLCVLALVGVTNGCSSKDHVLPYINISLSDGVDLSDRSIIYESNGGRADISIESNAGWTIECSDDWVAFSTQKGHGSMNVVMDVGVTEKSRSAVVKVGISGGSLAHMFDVIQHVSIEPTEPSEPDPSDPTDPIIPEEPEIPSDPTDPSEPDPSDPSYPTDPSDPSDPSDPTDPIIPEEPEIPSEPTDPSEPDPSDPSYPTDPSDPSDPSDPINPEQPDDELQEDKFEMVSSTDALVEGAYYIGGYPDNGILYLATGGLTVVNHCNTSQYVYQDGKFTSVGDMAPVEVYLEKAEVENGFYLRFSDDGYLTATGVGTGKLDFVAEKSDYWVFAQHENGGFELYHSKFKVKLIVSRKATENVLRSIADYEEGCAIFLFKHCKK